MSPALTKEILNMLIISIRTDKPEAELGLYNKETLITSLSWEAHRALAETIHQKILELLKNDQKGWQDLQGIVVFKGPGSFTGLRIGITVANTLAESYKIPIVGTMGENWHKDGLSKLAKGDNDKIVLPEYGADAHITLPKK